MKVLMVHNHYQQPGGEDRSFDQEARLLESRGHEVIRYTKHNDEISKMGRFDIARRTIWNGQTYRDIRDLIRTHRPRVAHFTNTFPLISPSAYYAASREGVAVVQSLRNYRLLCPGSQFIRDGKVCEDCLHKLVPWPGVLHACYRNSRLGSLTVASMLTLHRMRRTWNETVDMYYALTQASRSKFLEGGFPAEKVAVKPNFIEPPPEVGRGSGDYAIFVGRLAPEKGIELLLDAWRTIDLPLKIVGDGPMASFVQSRVAKTPRIEWLGYRNSAETMELVGEAMCLVMPSLWYEGFPRTILESFAKGTPVIASRLGSMEEIVADGVTGVHFEAGNVEHLSDRVNWCLANTSLLKTYRTAAREEFMAKYTGPANYEQLIDIYSRAIGTTGSQGSVTSEESAPRLTTVAGVHTGSTSDFPKKILLCHNYYQHPGGEDLSFDQEAAMLRDHGHEVRSYTRHNDEISDMGRVDLARQTVWSRKTFREVSEIVRQWRPDIMHCHNTFPLISPSAYQAAKQHGVPVIQTLRNFRLLCAGGTFLRNNRVCTDCLSKSVAWPAIVHRCYRDSLSASTVVAAMLQYHRFHKTWEKQIDRYIALTEFSRQRFLEGGFPEDRIAVKCNFLDPDPGQRNGDGGFAVFVGRLAIEKGIDTLLKAWPKIRGPVQLKIIGEGPMEDAVQQAAASDPRIEYLGWLPMDQVCDVMGQAGCLVMPSIWYETFGRTIIEAFAAGTPTVVSNMGAMSELVTEGRTGRLFQPGDPDDLAKVVQELLADPRHHTDMRAWAREEFESKYTATANHSQLMEIYHQALSALTGPNSLPSPASS